MTPVSYSRLLQLAMPEVIVVLTALIVLTLDLVVLRNRQTRFRLSVAACLASAGCMGAMLRLLWVRDQANVLNGVLLVDPLTRFVQAALLLFTVFTLLLSIDSQFTEHVGEFVLLVLLATTGMLFLVATQDILVIFISLELLSLSLYVLTGFNKHSPRSSEAALKYFLFGGMSAAFLLFGFSLLYGLSNSTRLSEIALAIHGVPMSPLLAIAIVTTFIGFGFKVAAFPFHFWAPDVYESAPIPTAAFIASASKVASFFAFFQIMAIGFAPTAGSASWLHFSHGWAPVLAAVAALSMVFGNVLALAQSSARRLLAYSAVAHVGYMLLAIVAPAPQSLAALLYYVITYGLATMGAIGVIGVVEARAGSDKLSGFDGLSRRSPVLSACLLIYLLSLAGIPPLAGFLGKFYLFVSALAAGAGSIGLLWVVILAIAMSAVSLYYYLQVLKRVFVATPAAEAEKIRVPFLNRVVLILLAGAVLLLGCAPNLLLRWTTAAVRGWGL